MSDLSRLGAFVDELKRRRVIRVAIVYGVIGFGIMQVAGDFFPALQLPSWTVTFLAVLIILGFPIALGLAWAFQVAPDRGAGTEDLHPAPRPAGSRAVGFIGVGILLGLVGFGLAYNPMMRPDMGSDRSIRSIAVLPFANLSTDEENEAFSDGLTEELLNALARIDRLRVPARTSSFAFKNVNHDISEIGRKLNVDVLLEGSVRKAADRLRISVQLISVADGSQLWSETYDRELADVFAIQEEIAESIVAQLLPRFSPDGTSGRFVDATTESVSAYQSYLQGRHQFWQQGGEEGLRRAAAFFEDAVQQDTDYALAYAGLADAYMVLGGSGFARPHDIFPDAKAAALKALSLDDRLAEGYVALASINWQYDWDWAAAATNYRRSFSVNPLLHTRCICYAWYLAVTGDRDAAVLEAERARTMDPLARLPHIISGWMYYLAGRYDDAQAQVDEIFAANAKDGSARRIAAWIHWSRGRHAEAVEELEKMRGEQDARGFARTGSPLVVAELATMYARTGREAEAREFAAALVSRAQRQYIPPEYVAAIHGALGEFDTAFAFLEEAFENRSNLAQFNALPFSEPLRAQPRYRSLIERVGLGSAAVHP